MLDEIQELYINNYYENEQAMNYLTSLYGKDTSRVLSLFKVGYSNGTVIGLGKEREVYRLKDGYIPIDIFTNRLTYPIYNIKGELLGYSARTINGNDRKYINSPTTNKFKKSEILYGLPYAYPHIKKHKCVYIVEGVTDVIALYLSGKRNVVATLGTALTKQHMIKLKKLTNHIIFMFDNDNAGQKAIERNYNTCTKYNVQVSVYVGLLDGHDVYDMYKKNIPFEDRFIVDYVDYTLNQCIDKLYKGSHSPYNPFLFFTSVIIPLIHKSRSQLKFKAIFEISNILKVSLKSVLLDINEYKEIDYDEWLDKVCDIMVSDEIVSEYLGIEYTKGFKKKE